MTCTKCGGDTGLVSLTYKGGWSLLNDIKYSAWAIVGLLTWISLLLGAILLAILTKIL